MIKGESKKDRRGRGSYNIKVLSFLSGRHEILPKENLLIDTFWKIFVFFWNNEVLGEKKKQTKNS